MIIRVPATTANLGPGYDSQGLALKLYNYFKFSKADTLDENLLNNLVYKSFKYFYEKNNLELPFINIEIKSDIPMTRGLGSSATCIVAGLMYANYLSGLNLNDEQILKFATDIEGHPDNVAPAILGGHITSFLRDDVIYYNKISVGKNLQFNLLIPDFKLETKLAREVVKKEVALKDAISNIACANLMCAGLKNGDINLIKGVGIDLIHEPYRKKLIEDYDSFKNILEKEKAALFISGAGPTLLVISEKDFDINKLKNINTQANWDVKVLEIEEEGAIICNGEDF